MKTLYRILISILSVAALAWFLPWLYSLLFPAAGNDPFIAYSPVSESFIISENTDDKVTIYDVDRNGNLLGNNFTKEQRDSLLPHIYFNQLNSRDALPDSLGDKAMTIQALKHGQWVFSSLPLEVNKRKPEIFLIMESMPVRLDLEDPVEGFRLNGKAEFIDMVTNTVNTDRSRRFTKPLANVGFVYPVRSQNANITTRKNYDEGHLLVDAAGDVYHMKMRGGRPYAVKVSNPNGIEATQAFILENPDTRLLGLVFSADHSMYALEHDEYKLVKLPVDDIDPARDRISVMKNIFNWVIKVKNSDGARWIAFDSDTYEPLATYAIPYTPGNVERVSRYIFPFELSFSSVDDSYARARIHDISTNAIWLNILLTVIVAITCLRRKYKTSHAIFSIAASLILGIYYLPVFLLIKD